MDDDDLRDLFAAFAMFQMTWETGDDRINAKGCYVIADAMIEAKYAKTQEEPEVGIVSIKPRRKTK